ncbi:hypothetical protein GIB67_022186 [Kingdonia uniflora]|uniref:Rx N-terminal domain-containing protein n=1 Tax=Kingdonia uniflora TaxID=39325 RepID=A0A7J7MVS9_9MAGN|nr:hypothetical protein GIB67_022186 [Kingdonia uniflora]
MAAASVSMVLNQLGAFLLQEIEKEVRMVVDVKEEIEKLRSTLIAIQAVLHDADRKQVQDQRVKVWLERLKEVIYEIEDILDKWNTKIIQSKIKTQSKDKKVCSHLFYPCFCLKNSVLLRHTVGRKIKRIREKLDSIASDKNNYGLANGIERLTSLRSLSKFIVSEGGKLGDLKGLNLIQGSIEISGLRRVKSVNEAKEVHLANKRGIHALALDFGSDVRSFVDISEGDKEKTEGVLEGLQPHPKLEELKINGYPGSKLPSWMILFSELRVLELINLTRCTTLPSLGRLPLLEVLKIEGMISVRRLGLDFLGISDIEEEDDDATSSINREKLVVFPKLIHLELKGMIMLEEWVLPFERSDKLQIMPRLRKLHIGRSYKLKVLPALGRLESLEELTIDGLHSLKRIGPEFFGISDEDIVKGTSGSSSTESVPIIVFPKLKKLKFSWMKEWEEWEMMMPSWREDVSFVMPCLKEFELLLCKKLKVVPHNIFSYQPVKERIEGCPQLNQRSRRNQIIRRREVGESYNRRGDHSDDDDFTPTKSLQGFKSPPTEFAGSENLCYEFCHNLLPFETVKTQHSTSRSIHDVLVQTKRRGTVNIHKLVILSVLFTLVFY